MFGLALCSATSRGGGTAVGRAALLEWLEYHLSVGVQHFFLYDTSAAVVATAAKKSQANHSNLADVLKHYIRRGQVVLIFSALYCTVLGIVSLNVCACGLLVGWG